MYTIVNQMFRGKVNLHQFLSKCQSNVFEKINARKAGKENVYIKKWLHYDYFDAKDCENRVLR